MPEDRPGDPRAGDASDASSAPGDADAATAATSPSEPPKAASISDLSLAPSAASAAAPVGPTRRVRRVVIGVTMVLTIAIAATIIGAFSQVDAVHAALASVFQSSTLKVDFTAHEAGQASSAATISQYTLQVEVTSENGSAPLSGSAGVDDFEISVLRQGVDLGDVVVADHAVYVRLDLAEIDPNGYANLQQSVTQRTEGGPGAAVAQAFLNDQWVGVDDSIIESLDKSIDPKALPQPTQSTSLRNSFATSFAQSWDTWASIHEVSSTDGTTEYTMSLPVREFVGTFVEDLHTALGKELPSSARLVDDASRLIGDIPSNLTIPITMWVTNGVLTQLDLSYKGNSLDLAISHPVVGVSPPTGATMLTNSDISGLLGDYGLCYSGNEGGSAAGAAKSTCSCANDGGSLGAGASTSPITFCGTGFGPGASFGPVSASGCGSGWSGVSGISGISGVSAISGSSGVSASSGTVGVSAVSGVSAISGITSPPPVPISAVSGVSTVTGISGISGLPGGPCGYGAASGAAPLPVYGVVHGKRHRGHKHHKVHKHGHSRKHHHRGHKHHKHHKSNSA